MATAITTDPGSNFSDSIAPLVYVSTDVTADDWALVPFLYCDELKLAANAYSEAKLHFELGANVLQPGDTEFRDWQPLSLRGKFIRRRTGA